ncbi:membrane-spanning 4-domains subfamily A member 7 isoform X3 [Aotus nancymaae]|uniref:membrane-spanning 4-domains subfamily A member 7 isoform X3 n=1 Tax=Aotus nancymaae TaxID=37293 RepID=UPI0030FE01B7
MSVNVYKEEKDKVTEGKRECKEYVPMKRVIGWQLKVKELICFRLQILFLCNGSTLCTLFLFLLYFRFWGTGADLAELLHSIISIMLLQSQTMRAFDIFTPKGITIPEREKPGHMYQKEDYLQSGLPKEATVLGTVQILCCLMISSLGVILVFASYPSRFNSAISTTLMSGYPFLGALCFGVTGSLSIISGKQSAKPFDLSSLTSNAVSSVTAGAGLLLLADSVVALRTASQHCGSEKEYLSSLPYSEYYYPIYEIRDCLLTSVSLTGVLVVMLIFTVLELLFAAYSSVFWWKQLYSNNPGSSFFLTQSQDHIQQDKKSSSRSWI